MLEVHKEEIRMLNGEVDKFKYHDFFADGYRYIGGGCTITIT